MKRILFAFLLLGIGLPTAMPQTKEKKQRPVGGTRFATVNIGYVFNNYSRATKFKQELEAAFTPYKAKVKFLQDSILAWKKALSDEELADETKEALTAKVTKATREIENLGAEMQRFLGKRQEDNLVDLWRDVQDGIKSYATQNDIELVFGFGDPVDKQLLDLFPNINRKMSAMDNGSAVPLFAARHVEIAPGVVELLNKRERDNNRK
jgi:Skp family chaperone for outer membrane proteins